MRDLKILTGIKFKFVLVSLRLEIKLVHSISVIGNKLKDWGQFGAKKRQGIKLDVESKYVMNQIGCGIKIGDESN